MTTVTVRVRSGHYNLANPTETQTSVYVEIPDVARAHYLLPDHFHASLRDAEWGTVLDTVHGYLDSTNWSSDTATAKARADVRAWLLVNENRDALSAAWLGHRAQQDPVARALLRDKEQLQARVAELEAERHATNEALADVTVAQRSAGESPLMVFRASHDSIVMGHYTTREAAREHCETLMRRDVGEETFLGWVPDHGGDDAPEELCHGEDVECSGYYVTPLEVSSTYDPDGDE
jgi:hypothetical protein